MDKKELRRWIRQKKNALSAAYQTTAGAVIARKVVESAEFQAADTVLIYVSMSGEPDTASILSAAWAAGKRVCVPRCRDDHQMDAVPIRSREDLQPRTLGILEPEENAGVIGPEEIDLIVVPCVSASLDGRRLGHGAGYYDRFLENSHAKTMCLCFAELLSEEIPMEETDIRMDAVITE